MEAKVLIYIILFPSIWKIHQYIYCFSLVEIFNVCIYIEINLSDSHFVLYNINNKELHTNNLI